jgi:hypothetical protein
MPTNHRITWLSDVHWSVTGCKLFTDEDGRQCHRAAELLLDTGLAGERGVPACVQCADLLLERAEIPWELRDLLPPLRSW